MTNNLHAHVASETADCDGRYNRDYVITMSPEETRSDWAELNFKERVMGGTVYFHAYAKVTIAPEGFVYVETTEEGYRHTEVKWCEDDCDPTVSTQRDHSAEQMGY